MSQLTKEEKIRRVVINRYNALLDEVNHGDKSLVQALNELDAMRDIIEDNDAGISEWTVSKSGRLRFRRSE